MLASMRHLLRRRQHALAEWRWWGLRANIRPANANAQAHCLHKQGEGV
jgi:hypothetical protein